LLLPHCISKEFLYYSARPEKSRALLKASCFKFQHYCVEQAKLQFSCLLAIVGSLPNLT
jgi:hypothetical protein